MSEAENMKNYRCPRWNEYPDLELYMDQVISVMEKNLSLLSGSEKSITPTMINNYVKQKLLPAPERKKYNRRHTTSLFMICILKRVLSINEINLLMDSLFSVYGEESAFNMFCELLEQSLKCCFLNTSFKKYEEPDDKPLQILCAAVYAFAYLTYARCMLEETEINKESNPEKSDDKAAQDKRNGKDKDNKNAKKAGKPQKSSE